MKRIGMIKGARRSAKQVVEKHVAAAIMKLEVCGAGPLEQIRQQLISYRIVAEELGWTDIEKKISNALRSKQTKGIFTDP